MDIVPNVVKTNIERFAALPNMSFSVADVARDGLPSGCAVPAARFETVLLLTCHVVRMFFALCGVNTGYEMVMCRHAFFHNTIQGIFSMLRAYSVSGARLLVATTLRPIDDTKPLPTSSVSVPTLHVCLICCYHHMSYVGVGAVLHVCFQIVNQDVEVGTDGRKIIMGGYRPVALEEQPFNLPPPMLFMPETNSSGLVVEVDGRQQGLGVWTLPLLQLG